MINLDFRINIFIPFSNLRLLFHGGRRVLARLTCFPGWNADAELSVLLLEKIFLS